MVQSMLCRNSRECLNLFVCSFFFCSLNFGSSEAGVESPFVLVEVFCSLLLFGCLLSSHLAGWSFCAWRFVRVLARSWRFHLLV